MHLFYFKFSSLWFWEAATRAKKFKKHWRQEIARMFGYMSTLLKVIHKQNFKAVFTVRWVLVARIKVAY
jgi:hypothetical protein